MRRVWGLGVGRSRSKFGKFLDRHRISQMDLADESEVSKSTIGRLCSDPSAIPNLRTSQKIIRALRVWGIEASSEDFW